MVVLNRDKDEGQKEAERLWKSGKPLGAQIPHELECSSCGFKYKSADCEDLRLHAAYRDSHRMSMSVKCRNKKCTSRIVFSCPYAKKTRKKPKVR